MSGGVDENRRFSSANRNTSRSDDVDESLRLSLANQDSASPDDADDSSRDERSAQPDTDAPNRRRAALATTPFLLLGAAVVLLSLEFAPQPLWAFLLVPPVAFMTVLTYLTFRSDFLRGR